MKPSTRRMRRFLTILLLITGIVMLSCIIVEISFAQLISHVALLSLHDWLFNLTMGAFCSLGVSLVTIEYQARSEWNEHVVGITRFARAVKNLIQDNYALEDESDRKQLRFLLEDFRIIRASYEPLKGEDDLVNLVEDFYNNSEIDVNQFENEINRMLQTEWK